MKVYHTFMSNATYADRLLIMEVRTEFGAPSIESPDPVKVLRRLRELCDRPVNQQPAQKSNPVAASISAEIDYDRLAALVVEKMAIRQGQHNHPAQGQLHRVPKGPCFRCGEVGSHYKRDCTNPPNPAKVAQAKRTYRHLNDQQLTMTGNRQL